MGSAAPGPGSRAPIPIYHVDAFAEKPFEGNPAAVCPLDGAWLPDATLQGVAAENNLAETAFIKACDDFEGSGAYEIRWFTPTVEVDLCGHATLASAHVLFEHTRCPRALAAGQVAFRSRSGELSVRREGQMLWLDFPALGFEETEAPAGLREALGLRPDQGEVFRSQYDVVVALAGEEDVRALAPDMRALSACLSSAGARGAIATAAASGDLDFLSRFFAPNSGIDEDPVTGSAHCVLIPFWAARLGKKSMRARQISRRGGDVACELGEGRVNIGGRARTFVSGQMWL
ncbi:unnamed protein product [Ostreobium quekettii]|uniref:Uncharacterized protein n=1 Tax=Ostreobium quekettii TaxID=121088 RepID=A0A8S1IVA4_9CHLO|nr:unnamed protein product [Ostreobium quekettii]|eukprot:evm.model.scf_859EXC.8 EVM.evm.TU.scf_859EXC.8   scf_859EXC:46741-48869(+)